jgi:hypothetical protein
MNKLLVSMLSLVFALGMCGLAGASAFSDVPTDHWAYEAIDYLQYAGLVEGYEDGTFRGDRAFTRYEMAMVIARVFTKMQDWQAAVERGDTRALPAEVDLTEVYTRLDRLSEEFRDELSDLGARVTALEDDQALMRSELDDLKELIKDSGLSGTARFRTAGFVSGGVYDRTNEPGFETYIQLNYHFEPDPNLDFNFSLTAAELEGAAGTGHIPGANNETDNVMPANPPFGNRSNASSFVLDQANFRYYYDDAPSFLGEDVQLTVGRQYFSEGEFGLAGDNGYRSNFGFRYDSKYGRNIDVHVGMYRMESIEHEAPWANPDTGMYQSSAYTYEADDYMLAGLEYHSGEATIPGHDHKLVVRADGTINGYGAEQYVSVSGSMQVPWLSKTWLTGIRGEWLYMMNNVSDFDPDGDLGLTPYSFIIELDVYNTEKTRVSVAGAQMAQLEALPVLANIDSDPFSEWDFTINSVGDAFNISREGPNYFPADFFGVGIQAEHHFGSALYSTLTLYQGKRVDAADDARPGMIRLNFRYPFTNNSSFGLDIIGAGERQDFEDMIGMVRGEFKLHF